MGVHIEWIAGRVGIVRMGPDMHQYGDPYERVTVLDRDGDDTVTIKGADSKTVQILYQYRHAFRQQLDDAGVKAVRWEVIRGGNIRVVMFKV